MIQEKQNKNYWSCQYLQESDLSTSALWLGLVIAAMYCIIYLLASVLPAPLSPETQGDTFYQVYSIL